MAITRQKKAKILEQLNTQFEQQVSTVFVSYRGTTVKDVTTLRNAAREEGLSYQVAKKNLVKIAAKGKAGAEIEDDLFDKKPFGVLFGFEDAISAPKLAAKFAKEMKTIEILGGVINGQVASKELVLQYATLPSREELLTKFAGLLRAPLTGFHGVIKSSVSGFARAVSEVAKQKEAGGNA